MAQRDSSIEMQPTVESIDSLDEAEFLEYILDEHESIDIDGMIENGTYESGRMTDVEGESARCGRDENLVVTLVPNPIAPVPSAITVPHFSNMADKPSKLGMTGK